MADPPVGFAAGLSDRRRDEVEVSQTGGRVRGDSTFLGVVPGRTGRGLDVVRAAPRQSAVDTLNGTEADESYVEPSPDGQWFVLARRGGTSHIVVLQNVPELARRIAAGATVPR